MLLNLSLTSNQELKILDALELKKNQYDQNLNISNPKCLLMTLGGQLYVVFSNVGELKIFRSFDGQFPRESWENLISHHDFLRYISFYYRNTLDLYGSDLDYQDEVDSIEYMIFSYPDIDIGRISYYKGKNKYYYRVIFLTQITENDIFLKFLPELTDYIIEVKKGVDQISKIKYIEILKFIQNKCLKPFPSDKELTNEIQQKSENNISNSDVSLTVPKSTEIIVNLKDTHQKNFELMNNKMIALESNYKEYQKKIDKLKEMEEEIKGMIKLKNQELKESKKQLKDQKDYLKDIDLHQNVKKLTISLKKEIDESLNKFTKVLTEPLENFINETNETNDYLE